MIVKEEDKVEFEDWHEHHFRVRPTRKDVGGGMPGYAELDAQKRWMPWMERSINMRQEAYEQRKALREALQKIRELAINDPTIVGIVDAALAEEAQQ